MTTAPSTERTGVPHANLPPQFTSFVGRATELDDLARLLLDPVCRLVTVTGQGGIGKTRLAIEVARRLAAHSVAETTFADGIWFVPLQAINSAERLVSGIAEALHLPPPGTADAHDHLLACLGNLQLLIILDTFEHLEPCSGLLAEMLTAGLQVKLLVTSRQSLRLEQEWPYTLDGLPNGGAHSEAALADAERLFVERARRVFPAFDTAAELENVRRICRLVAGMPLAIELAAAWARALPCSTIAGEIAGNLAFLSSSAAHIPEPHRSMRAVFARSWEMLNQEERLIFAQLSVFHGSFSLQAARAVVEASLSTLTALLDKSLLRRESPDHYRMHDLLCQYAAEQLQSLSDAGNAVKVRHCAYYADFLAQREDDSSGRGQQMVRAEIAAEQENIMYAFHYALEHRRWDDLRRGAYAFYLFYDAVSRFREGAIFFNWAIEELATAAGGRISGSNAATTQAELLVCLGWLSLRLGEFSRAQQALERSRNIYERLNLAPRPGPGTNPLVALGTLANTLGDYAQATQLGEEARRLSLGRQDTGNLMYAYYVLANAACARGQYVDARRYGVLACELAEQRHDRWFLAYLVADLGNVAQVTGDYAEALRQYQVAYAIRAELGDPEGIAVALVHLGQVSLLQGEVARAAAQFQQGLGSYTEIGDRGGEATALLGLGMAATAAGDYRSAADHLSAALHLSARIGFTARTNTIMAAVAELLLAVGQPQETVVLVVLILRDPASDRATSERARGLLERCQPQLTPDQIARATYGRQTVDLPAVRAALQLIATGAPPTATPPQAAANLDRSHGPLRRSTAMAAGVEPLSAREVAVLHLVAAGKSNQEIAAQLVITAGTAKWYVSQILAKLGVHSRIQAVARARELGLLP